MTFRRSLAIAFTHVFLVVGLLVSAFFLSGAGTTAAKETMVPHVIEDAPAHIMETRTDCWATPAEHPADLAGQEPGSVIVSGGEVKNNKVVHKVVEQAYFGVDHGFRVYGFCR